MAKKTKEVPGMTTADFDAALAQLGAEVLPFSAFLNSGAEWVPKMTNEDFLKEVGLALNGLQKKLVLEKRTLLGTDTTEIISSFSKKIVVRKKAHDYFMVSMDGMIITTTTS